MNDIQSMLKDLYLISQLNMSIFDIDGHLITSYPTKKCPFCILIEKNKEAIKKCHECDVNAFEKVKKSGKIEIYQCYFHLYEACVPLYTYGMHTGYLMMGQTLSNSLFDKEYLKNNASLFIHDKNNWMTLFLKYLFTQKNKLWLLLQSLIFALNIVTLTNRIEAKNKNLAQEVKQYIMQNYSQDITIEHLCSYFYCSKATLINHFKKAYQQTVHQYLLEYRLQKSKDLLNNKDLSIQEIAYRCGFKDANYFSKAFKKYTGQSPYHYKND